MISIFEKENIDQSDIEMILQNQMEESTYLEFKSASSLDNSDRNKKEISKDVSAFANADGGILIYGIKEADHKADSIDFIDGRTITKEWIENVIDSNIKRIIPDLKIIPIRFDLDIEKSIYVIKIPSSSLSPHMANDNRFYRRANYKILPMEEYEIRNQYDRKLATKLKIEDLLATEAGSNKTGDYINKIKYNISIQIKNIGLVIEKDFKVEMHIPTIVYQTGFTEATPLQHYFNRNDGILSVFSFPNTSPIFQNDITTIITFPLIFNKTTYAIIKNYKILLRLYYTSGMDEIKVDISDILTINTRPLKIEDFD